MISAARCFVRGVGLATAGAAFLMAGAWGESSEVQAEAVCKTEPVTASGRGKFRPFTKTKELEGRGSAMADAVASWQREVAGRFGTEWRLWSEAKDTTFECAPTKSGKVIGSSFIGCTITGRPCVAAESSGNAVVANSGDRRDDRREARETRERWEREHRYSGMSWAYRREMARQEHLAAWRRRVEEARWAREDARQRWLANARVRAENRGWAREEAHQRWLENERNW